MFAGFIGAVARRPTITLSGSLSKTGAPSGGNVTSDTVTCTIPTGHPDMRTTDWVMTGTVGLSYQINAGSFTAIAAEDSMSPFTTGDTLTMRITGAAAGESLTFNLRDNFNGLIIQTVTITAT